MARVIARCVWLLAIFSLAAQGQLKPYRPGTHLVSFEIQVYLPDGQKPTQPVALNVRSDNGRFNEVLYTTKSGHAFVTGVEKHTPLTVTVLPEEGFYLGGSVSFSAVSGVAEIYLKADGVRSPVVSVGSLYQPSRKVRKLYKKGLEDLVEGRVQPAEKRFEEAVALDDRYADPVIALGFLRIRQERFPDAKALFEKALELDPASPHALAGAGIVCNRQLEFAAAVEFLEKAAARLPDPEVLAHYGLSLLATDRREEAEKVLGRVASSENPYRGFSTLLLGRIYVERGDRQRGLATFQSLLNSPGPEADKARQAIRLLLNER